MSGSSRQWSTWRSGVRSAMRAASQLPGRGPSDVDDALHLQVNQKFNYDDNDGQKSHSLQCIFMFASKCDLIYF